MLRTRFPAFATILGGMLILAAYLAADTWAAETRGVTGGWQGNAPAAYPPRQDARALNNQAHAPLATPTPTDTPTATVTPLVTSTPTPSPSATATATPTPASTTWAIPRAELPPALDGDLTDWNGQPAIVLSRFTAGAIEGAVPEPGDALATLQMAWDADTLYLAVHVRDDVVRTGSPDGTGDDGILLALLPDGGGPGGSPRNHLYRITADGRQFDRGAPISSLTVVALTAPTGYDLEVRVPRAALGWDPIDASVTVPFNWALVDAEGAGIESQLVWVGPRVDVREP